MEQKETGNNGLGEIRQEIDDIDRQLSALFAKRMDCSRRVAEYKLENGLPIFNREREEQVLDKIEQTAGSYGAPTRQLYVTIMELSRALQHEMLGSGDALNRRILGAKKQLPFAQKGQKAVCFGVPGTYTNEACNKLFPDTEPIFRPTFHEVFKAIANSEAEFGVLPIENSSVGSVTEVYDLLQKYRFSIVSAIHIPIDHCLASVSGAALENIKTVYSHQQALGQCSEYLHSHKLTPKAYISTAAAAKMVSESSDATIAAICSEKAAKEYGLEILLRSFQDNPNNMTRFIVISKELYIEPDADKISLSFSLPHTTGSLHEVLFRFAYCGLNLTKIESRPVLGTDFEYMFYLDFSGNVGSRNTLSLLRTLSDELTDFTFLGNYKES